MTIRGILFDIDGTLVSTGGAGLRALETAFAPYAGRAGAGLPADYEPAGKTDWLIIDELFRHYRNMEPDESSVRSIAGVYLAELADEMKRACDYRVFAGVHGLIEFCSGLGLALGLGTGNLEPAARLKLAPGRLSAHFSFGGYGSDALLRADVLRVGVERGSRILQRPADPAEFLVIGDTPRDIEAARAIGAPVMAVATGPYGAEELREAELVVESLESPLCREFIRELVSA